MKFNFGLYPQNTLATGAGVLLILGSMQLWSIALLAFGTMSPGIDALDWLGTVLALGIPPIAFVVGSALSSTFFFRLENEYLETKTE